MKKVPDLLLPALGALGLVLTGSAGTLYVDINNPAPAVPYTNWAMAATNIQDAVDAAVAGDEVLVTNGVYTTGGRSVYGALPNRVAINKAVVVRSVTGPSLTWIVGQGGEIGISVRCVYVGTNAVLSGFTLTNGYTHDPGGTDGMGGGALCEPSGVVTNCILTGNVALDRGGGVAGGTLNNCTLTGNLARGVDGGGASDSTLNNCTLVGNRAYYGGGANGGTLNNCTLIGNSAYDGGGASFSVLNNCTLTSNLTSDFGAGGGAYYGTLTDCTLTGNSANKGDGGGASFSVLSNCTLIGNSARFGGGALGGTLNNCALIANSVGYDGGGAYFGTTLNNCTLTSNSATERGGGVADGTLNNCTLTGNSADGYGGGASHSTLNNSIVYHNTAPFEANYDDSSTFAYSCSTPLPSGPGNIDLDPLLASATHLSAQSPCIGRGSADYAHGVDIDGEAWLHPPCIGADQFITGAAIDLTVAIDTAYTNVASGFAVTFVAQNTGPIIASVWDFGDGVIVSNHPYASYTWAAPGIYPVRLTGYNDSWPGGVSTTVLVQVAAQEVYYVNAANPMPAFPYTSWAEAATNIQDAIDAGTQIGRLVRVTDGVYAMGGRAVFGTMTNRVVVTEGVTVRSENGPMVTLIVGQPGATDSGYGAIRCVYVGTNALLSGFSLTNGHTQKWAQDTERTGGGAWCQPSGVLTNCVLTGNSADYIGGGAYSGTLNNCTLAENVAHDGGGAYYGTLNNCTLTGNSVYGDGGGVYYGALNNCTLTGNSGAGAYGGTLNNCIVYYNTVNYNFSAFAYSCTTPLPSGPGNIANVPLFMDTNGWSNLRLQSNSPCINAGNNALAPGTTDRDGNLRIRNGLVDMGAYEFQSPAPASELPYWWLQAYGLPTDGSADYIDSDGDGLNNWQEWRCQTDPTNSQSALRLRQPARQMDNVLVTWESVVGVPYVVEYSTNLSFSPIFQALTSTIYAAANITVIADTNAALLPRRFYRVRVVDP